MMNVAIGKVRVLIFFVFISITGFGQPPQGTYAGKPGSGYGSGNMAKDGILKGVIIDAATDKGVEYASVGLYHSKDSSLVSGTITGPDGGFALSNLPYGMYYAEITFVGFRKMRVNEIRITPKAKTANLGEIKLQQSNTNIQSVEVVGNRPRMEYKIDKKVINVAQDITSTGGTAATVLENTPSIQTDVEGNISLRGSSNFTVLIDGRPSVLDGNDALQQIPSSSIQRIEIITNPSAKYQPDGTAGIINVIMKKEKQKGFNGILNASAGTRQKYNGDFLLNYRFNKVNIYGGFNFSDRHFNGSGNSERQTFYNDTTDFLSSSTDLKMKRNHTEFRGGADFYLNDNITLSLSGEAGDHSFGRNSYADYYEYKNPSAYERYYINNNLSNRSEKFYTLNASYQQKFKKPDQQLLATFYFSNENGDDIEDLIEQNTDANWNLVADQSSNMSRTREKGLNNEYRMKVDYQQPLGEKGKLEAGYEGRLYDESSDYFFDNWNNGQLSWVVDSSKSNKLDFIRNIQAAYGLYSNNLLGFDYQLGLRLEYTHRLIKQITTNEKYPLNRFDYFPTIHLSRQLPKNQQIMASYSRRINRPRHWYLNPFPDYQDKLNIRIGNPSLEPEYTDSYELNYQLRVKNQTFSIEGYYRQTNNKISRIQQLGQDNIIYHTFTNLERDYSLGLELMANVTIAKWFQLNASGDIFKYHINGSLLDSTVTQATNTWSTRLNATFRLNPNSRFQLTGMYNGPSVTAQGSRKEFHFLNAAYRQDFLKHKATLTLQARDILRSFKFSMATSGPGFTNEFSFRRESPIVMLSFTYRINNYKQKRNGSDSGVQEMDYNNGSVDEVQ